MATPPPARHLLELTATDRAELGRAALDWALKYLEAQSRLPIYPTNNPGDLTKLLASDLPIDPLDTDAVMADFEHVAANGRHSGHPRSTRRGR